MTDQNVANQAQPVQENKPSDKELNFRQLEARYEKQLAQERAARLEAEKLAQESQQRKQVQQDDDEDDSDPYIDKKRLNKTLTSFEKKMEEKMNRQAEEKAYNMLAQRDQEDYLRRNPDFYDVLKHAEKFAQQDPELAETILRMPEGFERQKLVYRNIKSLGLHNPPKKEASIQEKVDANRRSPYYQPSGQGTAPYASEGDFSEAGQKNAYTKMKELQKRLRI
jgi:hypothetical protein